MKLIFTWEEILVYFDHKPVERFPASCNVRNELNGKRKEDEVVFTYPVSDHRKPYYPRQFPSGIFRITGVEYTDDPEYAPVKIKTNATRDVFTWDLTVDGKYWQPTGRIQTDTAYWLHYTDSPTTLGCIRIGSKKDALDLARMIDVAENVYLEVL